MSYVVYGDASATTGFKFFTLNDLYELCMDYPRYKFNLAGTKYSLDEIVSWRGSYEIPSITPTHDERIGLVIANEIRSKKGKSMYGYKGGEYRIDIDDEFYISEYGCSEEYKISSYEVNHESDTIFLITQLDPY